jgi:hypothetical protein
MLAAPVSDPLQNAHIVTALRDRRGHFGSEWGFPPPLETELSLDGV